MRRKICPACDGTRVNLVESYDGDRNEPEPCMYCDGKGKVDIEVTDEKAETKQLTLVISIRNDDEGRAWKESIRKIAKENSRTMSNMVKVIVSEYIKEQVPPTPMATQEEEPEPRQTPDEFEAEL